MHYAMVEEKDTSRVGFYARLRAGCRLTVPRYTCRYVDHLSN